MARIRSLKPAFFKNEDLAALSMAHRLCYAGLWCWADRAGRLEDRPARLKAEIFPYDSVDMDALLTGLSSAGFIQRYEVDGARYIAIPTFLDHQVPRDNEHRSRIPDPPPRAAVTTPQVTANEQVTGVVTGGLPHGHHAVTPWRVGSREEEVGSREEGVGGSSALDVTSAEPARRVFLEFPVVGPRGPMWALAEGQVRAWAGLFPGLDIEREMRAALAWVTANPGRRKTARGMERFLVNWLTRSNDRRGGRATTPPAPVVAHPRSRTVGNREAIEAFLNRERV